MSLVISTLFSSIFNVILFSLIPGLWWLFRHRKEETFFHWIGLTKPHIKAGWKLCVLFILAYLFFQNIDFTALLPAGTMETLGESDNISSNVYAGMGIAAIIPGAIQAYLANGTAEEIFFRGFLGKRFCGKFGSTAGILLQAVCFALMHNLLYMIAGIPVGIQYHLVMFLFTGIAAVLLGILCEKLYNGSIIPCIFVHGTVDFIGTMMTACGMW